MQLREAAYVRGHAETCLQAPTRLQSRRMSAEAVEAMLSLRGNNRSNVSCVLKAPKGVQSQRCGQL